MGTNRVQLRPAREEDAPILVSILHAAFEEYRGRLEPPSGVHNETLDTVCHRLKTTWGVIAFIDNKAVGCVFYQIKGSYIYLGRLSVLPQYRQQSVGGALIDYVEEQAVRLQVPLVQLCVRIALPQLRGYYERRGYRIVGYGTHEGYTESTYAVLEKHVVVDG